MTISILTVVVCLCSAVSFYLGRYSVRRHSAGVILRFKETATALVQKHADSADMWRAALIDANAARDDAISERDRAKAEGEQLYADDFNALVDYNLELREQCEALIRALERVAPHVLHDLNIRH